MDPKDELAPVVAAQISSSGQQVYGDTQTTHAFTQLQMRP